MTSAVIEPRGIPTIFGEVLEKNVTFCVDTSGSMYKGIEMVKEHLNETLLKMGNSGKPYMFNIIEFNSEVTQWSDKLVTCTPQTVSVAKEWINKLQAKTGTNTKEALLTALNDPLCDAVYLVTDGLPDHHPADILDHVASIGGYRAVHCVYLSTEETTESAAIEFLEDLAIESYGSFHIVALTTHGCVERITPIYRAEHAAERVIRTINGTVRPNLQKCSVATTLQVDPDDSVSLAPRVMHGRYPPCYGPPLGPWCDWLSTPYRYYYPYAWSRYRPARGWLKSQEQMIESIETSGLSPAAGSLLINKAVLARRLDDGYFYKATVKSQVLSDKFLVGFGPCKHGKFTETAYQDTHVFDIIDYDDARRHTILTGDKVLAPWEPEGERYGPGTVLEGHEKRQAEGPEDKSITVSFTNGKVEKVKIDTAIWIPKEVYERLALELKMPKDARMALSSEESYPEQSFEGYPTSGPEATPQEYELADPMFFDYDPMVVERRGPWRYPFHPPYPLVMKSGSECRRSRSQTRETAEETLENIVPGTDLTQKELDERITSQLMEHKLLLDERETEHGTKKQTVELTKEQPKPVIKTETRRYEESRRSEVMEGEEDRELQERLAMRRRELEEEWRLEQEVIHRQLERERLLKREKQEENTLRKSVSFQDEKVREDLKLEEIETATMTEDSGFKSASLTTSRSEDLDTYFSDPEDTSKSLRERGVNTDSSLLYKSRSKLVSRRPPWKNYWRADPALPITNSSHGPFRETALQAPLEARNTNPSPYICEWTSPVYKFVDPMAKGNYTDSVEKLMRVPSAPLTSNNKAIPRPIPHRPMSADTKEQMRKDFKRRREEQREKAWQMRMNNYDHMNQLMQDQHKDRVMAQIQREKDRQVKEQRQIEISREQKKYVSKELREKIEASQKREIDKEQQRIAAMQRRREHREDIQRKSEKKRIRRLNAELEVKAQRSQERWDNVTRRLDQEDAENARRNIQHHNAKLNRIQHFQKLEEEGQQRKDVRIGVTDRHLSMFQSVPLC
ncbi:LOW QUALITY PROTEIN: uncharacterized protein LOC132751004 [Ruditapes philippinarum]|uniref:LOW QUALITY PROTEIN: uncharacterized protein LOC132751004 n=1 Tax=Ruditapes philippinarum TaxID=129788 RepID=UPI00295BAEF8|nr:LOW QUALITY PROTEIN: uncharacterized protein LOC132751004 [Ruditapes philippinarum]